MIFLLKFNNNLNFADTMGRSKLKTPFYILVSILATTAAVSGLHCYDCTFEQDYGEQCACRLSPFKRECTHEDFLAFKDASRVSTEFWEGIDLNGTDLEKSDDKDIQTGDFCVTSVFTDKDNVKKLIRSSVQIGIGNNPDCKMKRVNAGPHQEICFCNTDWCNGDPIEDLPESSSDNEVENRAGAVNKMEEGTTKTNKKGRNEPVVAIILIAIGIVQFGRFPTTYLQNYY